MSEPVVSQVPLRVLIADDHAAYRAGLARLLELDAQLAVLAMAADGVEAVDAAERLRPDVALLDVRMPGLDGVAACRRIRDAHPEIAVVLITGTPDPAVRSAATAAGAASLIPKEASPEEIRTALREAADAAAD